MRLHGNEVALDGDVVFCKCPTPQRIVATLAGNSKYEDTGGEEGAPMAAKPKYAMQKRTGEALVSTDAADTEEICPNMTNAEFRAHIMGLRDEALSLVANRLADLNRWSPADAKWFEL